MRLLPWSARRAGAPVLTLATLAAALFLAACGRAPASSGSAPAPAVDLPAPVPASALPRTRAERTGYTETSRYDDVVAFLDSLQRLGAPVWIGSIGRTTEGRALPYVIASRPLVTTPAEARRLGRPVVYVQGNIHAGEVEGKEALQALLRDLVFDPHPNALDSIVLIAVPIYNADGNERYAPQAVNRTEQNGPEMVGTRANAQGLDLNRDYVKAEAPETRASLAAFDRWDPDVFVDLHTTDGSFTGYNLTYSPSLSPAARFGGVYARDSLLPVLRRRLRTRDHVEIFDYGNFRSQDSAALGWFTYEPFPRYGTNMYGMRGRIAILSEAYSHDPFERRVRSTYAFVSGILSLVSERRAQIVRLSARADSLTTWWGRHPAQAPPVPIRSVMATSPTREAVIAERMARTGDSSLTQPGVPRGERRTGVLDTIIMPVWDRFAPALTVPFSYGYALDSTQQPAVRLLLLHGVRVERLEAPWTAAVERFVIDSVVRAPRPFQGHDLVTDLAGRWVRDTATLPAGSYVVESGQPLGILATYFLEPRSEDGFVTWNLFDAALRPGGTFPVSRVLQPVTGARRVVGVDGR